MVATGEKKRIYNKDYYKTNSDKIKNKNKDYYKTNSDKLKNKYKDYYKLKSEKIKHNTKDYKKRKQQLYIHQAKLIDYLFDELQNINNNIDNDINKKKILELIFIIRELKIKKINDENINDLCENFKNLNINNIDDIELLIKKINDINL
jgi:hypothetical protein